tara:strand:- start:2213 stop:2695 length:483 start_codon:yes stop_codon:yes gene_type:complete
MSEKINKKFLFIILIFVSTVLLAAFVIEHKLGHQPCKLCVYQRIPYFLSILIIIKIFFIKTDEKITLFILSILFIIGAILAFYHFGIEQGFFKESLACTTEDLSKNLSKEEILEQLKENTIGCKDVSFKIFGFSLAAINTIFSILLSAIFIRLFINYGKN